MTTAPSSKTSYVVLGSDAGPKKLELIAKHKIKTIDEDGLLRMIGSNKSKADDPKVLEAKKKEEEKIKTMAKDMSLKKDAPWAYFHLARHVGLDPDVSVMPFAVST